METWNDIWFMVLLLPRTKSYLFLCIVFVFVVRSVSYYLIFESLFSLNNLSKVDIMDTIYESVNSLYEKLELMVVPAKYPIGMYSLFVSEFINSVSITDENIGEIRKIKLNQKSTAFDWWKVRINEFEYNDILITNMAATFQTEEKDVKMACVFLSEKVREKYVLSFKNISSEIVRKHSEISVKEKILQDSVDSYIKQNTDGMTSPLYWYKLQNSFSLVVQP